MGKPFFITEKETEDLLERETRTLPMPDGTMRPFTESKLFWKAYEFLIVCAKWTGKELVALAVRDSEENGVSFERSFYALIEYADRHARKNMGID